MINSESAKRLARARASEIGARNHWFRFQTNDNYIVWQIARREADEAGDAVADELIEGNHHLSEGD